MSKTANFDKNDIIRTCEAACAIETPNLSELAREFNMLYKMFRRRIRYGARPRTSQKISNIVLNTY